MANTSTVPPAEQSPGPDKHGNSDHIAFVLVPTFFILGLLGVVICHVLKKKGYRCTTAQEDEEACEEEEKEEERDPELCGELNDTLSDNDTVGNIVQYIMKNEANSDALKAMVHENSIESDGISLTPTSVGPSTPPMTPVSPKAPIGAAKHTCNHLHTIGGPSGHKNICTRCSQKKWPLIRRPSARKSEIRRSHHGEVTVLAVGRFRVTKCEKPKERRTVLMSDSNGRAPSSPTTVEPPSQMTFESGQEQAGNVDEEKR